MIELTKQTTIGEVPIVVRSEGNISQDKWKAETYEDFKAIGEPSKKWIEGLSIVSEKEYLDTKINLSMGRGDRKVTHLYTNVYVEEDYTFIAGLKVDDAGCVYLNDEWIAKINGKTDYTIIPLNFHKGWNKLEIIFRNATGGDGVLFENKLTFDPKIKIRYESLEEEYSPTILHALEDNMTKISIKPMVQQPNYVSSQLLLSDMFYDGNDLKSGFMTMPPPLYGGVRFRFDHDFEYTPKGSWEWKSTKISEAKYRPFLLKPNTTYTLTYYTHEHVNEIPFDTGGYPIMNIWYGEDKRNGLSKSVGLNHMTITTDRTAGYSAFYPIRVCYIGSVLDTIPEGARRVLDVELISLVEGSDPITTPTPFFSSVGDNNGFSVYAQDYETRVGEYRLEGDIPSIIQNIDDRIEKKNNEFNITWI